MAVYAFVLWVLPGAVSNPGPEYHHSRLSVSRIISLSRRLFFIAIPIRKRNGFFTGVRKKRICPHVSRWLADICGEDAVHASISEIEHGRYNSISSSPFVMKFLLPVSSKPIRRQSLYAPTLFSRIYNAGVSLHCRIANRSSSVP